MKYPQECSYNPRDKRNCGDNNENWYFTKIKTAGGKFSDMLAFVLIKKKRTFILAKISKLFFIRLQNIIIIWYNEKTCSLNYKKIFRFSHLKFLKILIRNPSINSERLWIKDRLHQMEDWSTIWFYCVCRTRPLIIKPRINWSVLSQIRIDYQRLYLCKTKNIFEIAKIFIY